MKENWVIEFDYHSNGNHWFADGFTSETNAIDYAHWLRNKGIRVFAIWRAE